MNDHDAPEMEAFEDAPQAPEAMTMAPMMMGMPAGPAHKQLYQFFWGGCAVLFGCLLRFNSYAAGWDAKVFNPGLEPGPFGFLTVGGSIVAFTAILYIGAQIWCMTHRRVLLGPIVIMLCTCVWAWLRVVAGFGAEGLTMTGDPEMAHAWTAMFYKADTFVAFWHHLGPGFLFIWAGSTYVILIFFKALLGLGGGKKSTEAAADAPARGRGRRR